MSLSSALGIINSAFVANAAQSAVISSNISNAGTKGYAREIANLATITSGGVEVTSVGREANAALLEQVNTSTSQAAYQQALSDGLTTLANTVSDSSSATSSSGATANGNSPSAMLANLQSALETYDASPSSTSAAQGVVTAAADLTQSLNTGAAAVQSVRETADSGMASAVNSINSLLTQFTSVNATIVSGTAIGADVSSAQDTRDSILAQLSQQIGISTVSNPDGSTSIYTDSGVTLFQGGSPRTVSFTPTATYTDGATGNAVMVDGVPITGASSPMAIQSGALAGLANLRDVVAPQYGAQLDQIAGGLISAFAESDQTGSATPAATLPGLFTFPGATGVPAITATTGLASEIEVNANVDPSQGGDVNRLRDGGIADPTNSAYTYNTTNAASYTGRIAQLISATTTNQTFGGTTGLGTSSSLSDYASSSVSWLQSQHQAASNQLDYQNSLVSQATTAASNATGVNLDTEMTNMLTIENSYTTTAKLLTTVNAMFTSLLNAV
ncbi:MAG: flagellar hook-associated protein FlgK [Roseiarcus sp.]|jgi:flagellar hook-associated protein 1 FlgK